MSKRGTWSGLLGLAALALPPVVAAHGDSGEGAAVATLARAAIVAVEPAAGLTREAFGERWGQFEIQVRRQDFPVPAPHCRRHVILRVPAVAPDAPGREQQLEQRWTLYRQALAVQAGREAALQVPLDLSLYTERSDGKVALRYCNAYARLR
ncbi:hypothetical protein [Azohydromonas aeria]|uniref:hypothetical protein n=1 Tax=Azohydromonas aeria TaxID=2590212 RepID=UPI0012FAC87F|nr:hypothetical protein [Azohydromonas aeria]